MTEVVYGTIENDITRSLSGVKDFVMNYQKWKNNIQEHNKPSLTLAQIISDINFEAFLKTSHPEDFDERWLNVIELKNALVEYENFQYDDEFSENSTPKTGLNKLSLLLNKIC